MRGPVRDLGRLEHILEQIQNVQEFVAGKELTDLHSDKLLQYAIVKSMEIIGEACYMLSLDFKEHHPEVDWNPIIKMRHVLVHGYYHISLPVVWSIIHDDLPQLRPYIVQYIEELREVQPL